MRGAKRLLGHLEAFSCRCLRDIQIPGDTTWPSQLMASRGTSSHAAAAVRQSPLLDLENARRMQEMLAFEAARTIRPRQRRKLNIDDIPAFSIPQQSKQPASNPSKPVVDWRQIVEQVRASRQTVSGEQMLTDRFR